MNKYIKISIIFFGLVTTAMFFQNCEQGFDASLANAAENPPIDELDFSAESSSSAPVVSITLSNDHPTPDHTINMGDEIYFKVSNVLTLHGWASGAVSEFENPAACGSTHGYSPINFLTAGWHYYFSSSKASRFYYSYQTYDLGNKIAKVRFCFKNARNLAVSERVVTFYPRGYVEEIEDTVPKIVLSANGVSSPNVLNIRTDEDVSYLIENISESGEGYSLEIEQYPGVTAYPKCDQPAKLGPLVNVWEYSHSDKSFSLFREGGFYEAMQYNKLKTVCIVDPETGKTAELHIKILK